MNMHIIQALFKINSISLLEQLLDRHPNLIHCDFTSKYHYSLLHMAIKTSRPELVECLIKKGAKVNRNEGTVLEKTYDNALKAHNLVLKKKTIIKPPLLQAFDQQKAATGGELGMRNINKIIEMLHAPNDDLPARNDSPRFMKR